MKVVIVGAEAIGSVLGAHLARAGEEVIFLARGQRALLCSTLESSSQGVPRAPSPSP